MASHVNGVPECPLCEEKLINAFQSLSEWFRTKVKGKYPDCHISWSYRPKESQEEAFLDGKSKLHFPNSAHNKSNAEGQPCAMALDLFELDLNGMACWHWSYFKNIALDAENEKLPIKWGGQWVTLGDADHFEWNETLNA